jgi:type II restriction/modification system DNA methylase subunit YeeA
LRYAVWGNQIRFENPELSLNKPFTDNSAINLNVARKLDLQNLDYLIGNFQLLNGLCFADKIQNRFLAAA